AARGIAEAFEAMADEHAGIAKARLTTAIELSDEQRKAIEEQLSRSLGKTVRATTEVDPAILGGIIIRVGDQLVDGSIRTRLRLLEGPKSLPIPRAASPCCCGSRTAAWASP